jgi:1-acyl-sn-glycerol-3-phosphate acyltransferase
LATGAASALSGDTASHLSPDRPNLLWRSMRRFGRTVFPVWLRFRSRGVEKIPKQGPALLLINHQSFLDSMVVGVPLSRPVSYLTRDSLFRVPIVGWILRNSYTMPVNRESASSSTLRLAADRLKRGFLVGIFPEGTRSRDGQLGPLKPGFIALIRKVDFPVIPVGIAGTAAAWPRNAWFVRPKPCRVVFGDPIPTEVLAKLVVKGNEEALIDEVRRRMSQCLQEAQEWVDR